MPWVVRVMSDPYLDALEQLDTMRDRAFKAEAVIQRMLEWESANRFYLGDTLDRTWGFNKARREVRAILEGESDE